MKKIFLILFFFIGIGFLLFPLINQKAEAAVTCYNCSNRTPSWSTEPCDGLNAYQRQQGSCVLGPGQICDATQGCITPPSTPGADCFYCPKSSYNSSTKSCNGYGDVPSVCTLDKGQVCDPTKGCISEQQLQCSNTACLSNNDCCSGTCQNGLCLITQPGAQPGPGLPAYGGAFGGPGTTFSCGSGANAVWTLDCIFPLMANVIYWLLQFSGIVAIVLIIIAGIRFITSGGDPKRVESGKKMFTFALIGLVIIFLSFFILNFIAKTTGVACINPQKPLSFTSCGGHGAGGTF